MRQLLTDEVHGISVQALGLDPTAIDLTSIEALTGLLRRTAGFLCPCSANMLIYTATRALHGLVDDMEIIHETVRDTLNVLISYGDLLEYSEINENEAQTGTLLYTAPPTFIALQSGTVILLGIFPDNILPLPYEVEARIEYINHVRRIPSGVVDDLSTYLIQLGFIELSQNAWLKPPSQESALQHLSRCKEMLAFAPPSGEVSGVVLLDPMTSVRYYRNRWVEPTNHTGQFVGRRAQVYGADLWCYIEVSNGTPIRFIDLPLRNSIWRGCDEAWRLQAAIDHERGVPQVFRVRTGSNNTRLIDFFSPVPMWAIRRWDAVGEPIAPSRCLFSYKLKEAEVEEELNFIEKHLWLAKIR